MEKKLAVIVDNKEEVTTGTENTEMCSSACDVAVETCSSESHGTCGDNNPVAKGRINFICVEGMLCRRRMRCITYLFVSVFYVFK